MIISDILQKIINDETTTAINYNDAATGEICTAYLYHNVIVRVDSNNRYIDLLIEVNSLKDLMQGIKTVNCLLSEFIQSDDVSKFSIMLWPVFVQGKEIRILDNILDTSNIQLGIA